MGKPICVLLIHGFGGSEREVLPLAQRLEERDINCKVVRLAGHGEGRKQIDKLTWQTWVDSVRCEYKKLVEEYRVVGAGFSMGGLIAAILNQERSFESVIFINTPVYFWHVPQILRNFKKDFKKAFYYYFVRSAGRVNLYTMREFVRILLYARKTFSAVECPSLVIQSKDDDSVWPVSAGYISSRVKGPTRIYRPECGSHRVLLEPRQCDLIAGEVETVIKMVKI